MNDIGRLEATPSEAPRGWCRACHPSFSSAVEMLTREQLSTCGTLAVTPEAAGSSPVDPANYPSQSKEFSPLRRYRLANVAGGRGHANLQDGGNPRQKGSNFWEACPSEIVKRLMFSR
jgi:hypothetical protein